MASLYFCVSCKCPFNPPHASFCSQCGSPQLSLKLCVNCKAQLPPNAVYCGNCGLFQTHPQNPDSSMKLCVHCEVQLPPNATVCKECGKTQKVPCILCKRPLWVNTQNCAICSAAQDPEEFKKQSLKECYKCGVRLLSEAQICHKIGCYAHQNIPSNTGALPIPNVTINLDVKESIDDKTDRPDDLKSIPELQLQPSDQPKEEQCKSPQHTIIPGRKIFGKNSGHDENESNDKTKKSRTLDAAVTTSGAVVQQNINIYGIEGESDTKSLDGDHQAAIVDTRKRKKIDQDDSQGSFIPPLAKKVEDGSNITITQTQLDSDPKEIDIEEKSFQTICVQADPKKLECNDETAKQRNEHGQENRLGKIPLPDKQEITNQTDPSGNTDLVGPSSSTPSSATPAPSLPALVTPFTAPIVPSIDPVTSSASATCTLSPNSSLATATLSPATDTSSTALVTSSLASVTSPATGIRSPNASPAVVTSSSTTTTPSPSPSSALVTSSLASVTSPATGIPSPNASPAVVTSSSTTTTPSPSPSSALVTSSLASVTLPSATGIPSPNPCPAVVTSSLTTTTPSPSSSSAPITLPPAPVTLPSATNPSPIPATSSPTYAIPSANSSPTAVTPSTNALALFNSALALVSSSPNPVTSSSAIATPSCNPSPDPSSTSTPPTAGSPSLGIPSPDKSAALSSSIPSSLISHTDKCSSESGDVPNDDKRDVDFIDRPIEPIDPQQQATPVETASPKPKSKGGEGKKGEKKDKVKVDKQTDRSHKEKKPEDSISKEKEPSHPIPNL